MTLKTQHGRCINFIAEGSGISGENPAELGCGLRSRILRLTVKNVGMLSSSSLLMAERCQEHGSPCERYLLHAMRYLLRAACYLH